MTNNWGVRQAVADEAVAIFTGKAHIYGFELVEPMGAEFDSKDMYCQLRKRSDKTSVMLRHRPDAVCFNPNETVLMQIKAMPKPKYDGLVRDSVFVEVDSWAGAMEWNAIYRHVAFAFVDLLTHEIWFAWADELFFDTIFVPEKHHDYENNIMRMTLEYPDKKIISVEWRGGSGTPCFKYSKEMLSAELNIDKDFRADRSRPVPHLGGSAY